MERSNRKPELAWIHQEECERLLADEVVGRVAVVVGDIPVIFPVNYVLDGHDIIFRTDAGTKLEFGPRAPASFEVDSIERATHSGWSVVATGRLEEVTEYHRSWPNVTELAVESWASGPKQHWMRLVPERVTGRRLSPTS